MPPELSGSKTPQIRQLIEQEAPGHEVQDFWLGYKSPTTLILEHCLSVFRRAEERESQIYKNIISLD